jgi:dipeptidyl aminopeptidase/acylaminoacyl peptidase
MKNSISKFVFAALLCASMGVQASLFHEEFETFSAPFQIPGHVFLHEGTCAGKPTMFWCHGGPHAFTEINFLEEIATSLGVNMVGFDFRGSIISGYKDVAQDLQLEFGPQMMSDFYHGTSGEYGAGHMDDLKSVVSYVKKTYGERLNTDKFIIAGHSFGGYMAAMAVTDPQFSTTFKLGVLCSGFYDLGIYSAADCVGDDMEPEIQRRRSPLSFTHNITQPLVLVHGGVSDKTSLVNTEDAEKFVVNAREKGKNIQTLFMDGEGHDYSKPAWAEVGFAIAQAIAISL